jgi:hypothetical protein
LGVVWRAKKPEYDSKRAAYLELKSQMWKAMCDVFDECQRDKKQRLARQAQWRAMRERYPLEAVKLYLPGESPEADARHEKAEKLLAQLRSDRQLLKRKRGLVEWRDVDLAAAALEREVCACVNSSLALFRQARQLRRRARARMLNKKNNFRLSLCSFKEKLVNKRKRDHV